MVSALCAAMELGLQPALAHRPDGLPLYCPYPLRVTIPVMVGQHLLFFGWMEAVVTGLVVKTLTARNVGQQEGRFSRLPRTVVPFSRLLRWPLFPLAGVLLIMILLAPLGMLERNPAWGEWSAAEIRNRMGFLPQGLARLENLWRAPMAGYERPLLSAALGATVLLLVGGLGGRLLARRESRRRSFIEKTLSGIEALFEDLVLVQDSAEAPGLLQRLDPRMKIVTLMTGLVVTTFIHRGPALGALYGLTVALAGASRLPLQKFLARTWVFVPLFTLVMVLPTVFRPGGWSAALLLVLRAATAISWTLLLVMSTRWDRFLRALQSLGLPTVFIVILTMTLRSLQILLRDLREMQWALESRTVSPLGVGPGQRAVAAHAGTLFRKACSNAHETYLGMLARGYSGETALSELWRLRALDFVWAALCLAGLAAVGWWGAR
jgi:cobalt/nickel transport system permease protein